MAITGFGVTELNLIGSSGTPKIESPNNLNLNAVTVAISTNLTVGGTLDVDGHTELDGVNVAGAVTATSFSGDGSNLTGVGAALTTANLNVASLVVAGVSTFSGNTKNSSDSAGTYWGANDDLLIKHTGESVITNSNSGRLSLQNTVEGQTIEIEPKGNVEINRYGGAMYAEFKDGSSVDLYFSGSKKFETTSHGTLTTGISTATGFRSSTTTGNGSDVAFAIKYYITSNGASAYRFAGAGSLNTDDNPTLYFHRGFTYILENSTGGSHPFELRVTSGGSAYAPGGSFLTGSTTGTQILTVPYDAPASIVYQCTIHGGMVGTINFVQ